MSLFERSQTTGHFNLLYLPVYLPFYGRVMIFRNGVASDLLLSGYNHTMTTLLRVISPHLYFNIENIQNVPEDTTLGTLFMVHRSRRTTPRYSSPNSLLTFGHKGVFLPTCSRLPLCLFTLVRTIGILIYSSTENNNGQESNLIINNKGSLTFNTSFSSNGDHVISLRGTLKR